MPLEKIIPGRPAITIDEVIHALEQLIAECMDTKDPIGYFAALYHKVTVRVRAGILQGEFENNARMERLDVIFANRYLQAVIEYRNGQKPSGSWQAAFDAARQRKTLVLQHLLLGMNAHINLDLGIAAVETTQHNDLRSIRHDFNSINSILGSLTFEVMNELNRVSPLLSLFGFHANNESILIQFSLTNARDGAWAFAEDLCGQATKPDPAWQNCLQQRDATIQKLGLSLVKPTGLLRFTSWLIRLFEWKNPAKVIRAFYTQQKKFIHPNAVEEKGSKQTV